MAMYEVEAVRHRYYRVRVEADSLALAIIAVQDGEFMDTAEVMYDGDDELTELMGLPAAQLRPELREPPDPEEPARAVVVAKDTVCGVFAAYPVALDAPEVLTIIGSHGQFECVGYSGLVWSSGTTPLPAQYANITRIDVAEYEAWCTANGMPMASTIDILLVGYWYDGDNIVSCATYEPPQAEHRAACLAAWQAP
jgi:hypothetical protein